jgi:hypothetical protein
LQHRSGHGASLVNVPPGRAAERAAADGVLAVASTARAARSPPGRGGRPEIAERLLIELLGRLVEP